MMFFVNVGICVALCMHACVRAGRRACAGVEYSTILTYPFNTMKLSFGQCDSNMTKDL